MLCSIAYPVQQDLSTEMAQINLSFPSDSRQSFPVGFVHDRNFPTPASDELMATDVVDENSFNWSVNIFGSHVERGRLGGMFRQHVLTETQW